MGGAVRGARVNAWLIRGAEGPASGKRRPSHPYWDPAPAAKFPEPALSERTSPITVYTSAACGYCVAAKNFLKSRGLAWNEVRVDLDPAERERIVALTRRTSVPQIFIGDTHAGGSDDMMALHRAGGLAPLLEAVGLKDGAA